MERNVKMPCIAIVMATYNGEKYICEQLDSIIWQTYKNWKLYIRDDGSTDNTCKILQEYAERYPTKIQLVKDLNENLGICNNFFYTLGHVKENYVMFSDQDDVWLKEKIEVTAKRMFAMERKHEDKPILVHTDAIVTDENLEPLRIRRDNRQRLVGVHQVKAYRKAYYSNFKDYKYQVSFANLLLKNTVQGMTIMMNKLLLDYMQRLTDGTLPNGVYHDSLIASIASIVGVIEFQPVPTVLYRQHGKNTAGAFEYRKVLFGDWTWKAKYDRIRLYNYLLVNKKKALFLRKKYIAEMNTRQRRILNHYIYSPNDWKEFKELGLDKEFTSKQKFLMRVVKFK